METKEKPIPGVDFPRTFQDFDAQFSTEKKCRDYLRRLKWSEGFLCPRCGETDPPWLSARDLYHCRYCQWQMSLTSGTIFEGTRKSLRTWFLAMWFVMSQKHGTSALGLQRVLGLGSYETAWTWLHKLRRAMVRPERDQLCGEVEVDETLVGGVEIGGGRRHIGKKALVIVAAEARGSAIGRIRLKSIPDSSSESIIPFVQGAVAPGSTVISDGLPSYLGLTKKGYIHQRKVQRGNPNPDSLLPRVHRVASLLKRWLLGIHQGAVSKEHLNYYMDEFTFRFNRRNSRSRGMLFFRLVQQAANTAPAPYKSLIGGG